VGRSIITLFILLLPLLEIAGFVVVGSQIGALATVALVIASTVLGAILMRFQGFGALRRAQAAAASGGEPDREIAHGAMILIAGILLIIPGFITDILGLLLFIPAVRDIAWRFFRSRIAVMATASGASWSTSQRRDEKVIDLDAGDYRQIDPESPWKRNDPEQ
jgi:UPF0716 protein FxsA